MIHGTDLDVLPPHLLLQLVGVALEDARLLLQFCCCLFYALQLDAVLQRDVNVLLHDELDGVHFLGHGRKLVHGREVIIGLANLQQQAAAWFVQGPLLGGGGLVAEFGHELRTDRWSLFQQMQSNHSITVLCSSSKQA